MNKRDLKRALKAYAIRELWYRKEALDEFQVLNNIRTERQKERAMQVLLEIMKEWD